MIRKGKKERERRGRMKEEGRGERGEGRGERGEGRGERGEGRGERGEGRGERGEGRGERGGYSSLCTFQMLFVASLCTYNSY